MGVWLPRQEPLPRRTLNSFQNILKMNRNTGKKIIIPSSPKNSKHRLPNQQKPFRRLLTTLKGWQKAFKKEQILPGKTSTTLNHLYTSIQIDHVKGDKRNE
jgi:hypothetical protein